MALYITPWSVRATAGMPISRAVTTMSFTRHMPSSRLPSDVETYQQLAGPALHIVDVTSERSIGEAATRAGQVDMVIVGAGAAGVVAGAQAFPLSDGSGLQITTVEIYSDKGERIDRTGLVPDELLDSSQAELEQGRDIPLEAAVLYVWGARDRLAGGAPAAQ